jgi:glucokinase
MPANANAFTIGVDLGGTNLRIGAYTHAGGLLETIQLPTRLKDGREEVVRDMCGAIRQLIHTYRPKLPLAGVGIGSPGPLELPAGILRQPPNLPGWDGFELRANLESALNFPVVLQNDANAAALAECLLGRGKSIGVDSLCMLTLGTGVGGGIILHGNIWDGITGMGGEVGHLNIWTEGGMACGCGGSGCLEPHASATGVRRSADEKIARGNATGLAALHAKNPAFDARDVAELAKAGDLEAKAIFEKVGRSLGIGLASLVNVLNLPLYILGGGLANAWDLFSTALFDELRNRSYVYRLTADKTRIMLAELGPDAGLLGACLLPLQLSP